jgi:NADH:ubiquinone oxidoreductase subunit 2 (subunit N)
MLFSALTEISLSIGFILIVLYGLFSLTFKSSNLNYLIDRTSSASLPNLHLSDVYFFTKVYPFMFLLGYFIDLNINLPIMEIFNPSIWINSVCFPGNSGIDLILIILTVVIMQSFKTFESTLLLLLAFIGQIFMIHSCDFVSFYICLELTNFVFLVLCGLQPRSLKTISSFYPPSYKHPKPLAWDLYGGYSTTNLNATVKGGTGIPLSPHNNNIAYGSRPIAGVEASIKYLLLSAFSSGVLLFWFSVLYLHTGITNISTGALTSAFDLDLIEQSGSFTDVVPQFLILISLMFKLGAAPLHLWAIDIYSGVKRQLIMYLSTAPKLSLFGFWISSWHNVWTDYTVVIFVILSSLVGCFGAYSQPTLRSLFAYSTVNEIGLLLMAIETAGFHSLFQHLTIYIVTMLLLWSNTDKRLFAILAISLAGLPPLAGFFGKAWIFNSVAVGSLAGPYIGVLLISLFCTGLSLVYYLRVFRLFSMTGLTTTEIYPAGINSSSQPMGISTRTYSNFSIYGTSYKLTSFCVIFLIFAPLFYIKPFVL